MQILVLGDLHYDMRQLDWVLAHAADHDAVIITGDLLDISSVVPLRAQVPVVLGYLERLVARVPTIVCSGNHDLTSRDADGEKVAEWLARAAAMGVVTDFGSTRLDGALVSVCPFWDGPIGRSRVDAFLAEQADLASGPWWWIYHWPPPGLPVSWIGERYYGDGDLKAWIETWNPTLVLTGHVHQSPFITDGSWAARADGGTWVLNAGHLMGPTPSYIVLDTVTGDARWVAPDGAGQQSLGTIRAIGAGAPGPVQ